MDRFSLFTQHPTQSNRNFLASIDVSAFFQMVLTAASSLLHEYSNNQGHGTLPAGKLVKDEELAVDAVLQLANGKHRVNIVEGNTRHMRFEIIEEYAKYKSISNQPINFLEPHQLPILVYYVLLQRHMKAIG